MFFSLLYRNQILSPDAYTSPLKANALSAQNANEAGQGPSARATQKSSFCPFSPGLVAVPTVLIGGGLLLLFSPVLLFVAVITSPIWGPIAAIAIATPPVLGTITVALGAFGVFVYWFWNFIRCAA
jgi:hypothetical protein